MIALIRPATPLHTAWLAMAHEFDGAHIDGAGFIGRTVDELADAEIFADWVAETAAHERGEGVPPELVPATLRWVVDDLQPKTLLGTISLRHQLNDYLRLEGGHIGYAVRPTARGQGVATTALGLLLTECRVRGIDPVLVTCHDGNVASARTIERQGGELQDVIGEVRRYWVSSARR